jgi:PAS domain S-box-containing protein
MGQIIEKELSISDFRLFDKDKNIHWVRSSVSPVFENGIFAGGSGTVTDITAQKIAEEELIISEQRYRSVFENIQDTYYEATIDGILLEVSPSVKILSKGLYERADLLGMSLIDIYTDPTERERFFENILKNGKASDYELTLQNRDGSAIPVAINSTLVCDESGVPVRIIGNIRDISERKIAERALQESEKQLNTAQEIANMGSWQFMVKSGEVKWSENYYRLMGEKPGSTPLSLEEIKQRVHPSDRVLFENKIAKIDSNKTSGTFYFRLLMQNGEIKWIQSTVAPVFDGDELVEIDGISIDITEKKKSELQIEKQKDELQAIVTAIPDMIFILNDKGVYLEYFASETEKLGAPRELIIGHTIQEALGEKEASVHLGKINECIETQKTVEYEYSMTIDGDENYFEARLVPMPNRLILSFIRDISKRKQSEIAIKKLSQAVEQSPVSIVITNLNGNIEYANPKACETTGYSFEELRNQNPRVLKSGETSSSEYEFLWHSISHGNVWQGIFHNKRKNGELFWESSQITPITDEKGKIINYLAIKEDITDRKKTQEDLMRSESRFSQIAEQSQTVIWEVDKNGLYTFISKVSKVVWGYEPEELVGKKYFYDLHPTEGREEFKESALQIFAQKVVFKDLINSIVTASNKLIWVSTNATPIIDNDDNLIGYRGSDNDITNKKLAEEALKQSEEALNYAQQIANMGSWSLDLTNNKLTCSKNYFNIMGIPACSEMNSQIFFERVHPEDIHLVDEKLEEMNLFKKPVIYDIRLRMPDNEYGWIQNNIIPEFEDEILIRYKGVNIDVTEKKQAEENIRKQNERLSAIINAIPDLIFVSDREGTYLEYYNVSNQELLHPADQLIGLTVLDLFEEETAYLHIRKINECLQTKKLVSYDYSTSINGTIRYFEARLAPLGNDKVLRFIRDFTQEKQKDKEIKKLSLAVEQSPVIIVITDLAGDIEYVNPAFYETTGYELDEVLGKNTRILKSGETDPTVYVDMWKTIAAGDRWNGEWINKKKNGELYWENVSITPIRDDNGKVTNYMAITQDISQRKQSEQEIRDLNTNLEHKIEERTHQLAKTNENLLSEIEERKRIENALSESEKSYRTVVENVNEVIFLTDAEGLWVFLNKSWEVVTGFTVEESLGKHYTNFIHPLDLERNRELIEPLNNRKKDYYREETRYLTKEGGFRWIEVFARLQLNENDEITGSYGTLMDITERKLAEIALAIEKQRLANIIEGTNVGTWEWNIQTGETVFNERWAEILGYTLEELLPVSIETWLKLAHPDDLKISGELLEKHFKGELDYYSFESRMKHKTGDWVWVLDRGKVHTWDMDGKPLIMSGTHQDITDRKFADDFENQILQLSTKLAGVTTSEINSALKLALLRIGQFLNADRAYIFEFNMSNETMNNTHEWCNEGIQPEIQNLQNLPYNIFPNWLEIMQVHNNVIIPSVQDLPENRQRERELLEPQGIQSLVAIPLLIENNLIGFVGLDSVKSKRNYNSTEINILKVWSGMLSSLINNQRSGKLLEQTRQNYETFFNTIDDFLFIFDEQGNIVDTNNTVNVRLGYSNAELNNKSVLMVRPPERHEEALSVMQEILEGKAQYCSIPLITKSGEKIPVETRIKRGYWNGSPVIFGVSKDISQILLSEQKFASAFHLNTAVMAITRFDNDQFVDVNNAFVNTLGYSREDIKGKTLVTLGVVRENTEKGTIQDAINMGIALREIEIIAYSKTNELFIFLLSAEEIYVGLVRCVLSVAVNITERKTMENELRKAREDADRANMAKSEFLSRMSHELRTPMNSILGFAQLMEMGVLNDRQKSGVNHILRSGKYLLNMINEVLELSRIESGRLSLSIEPVDINAAINEILDFIKPQSEQKNISIHNYAMSDELFINADKQKVKQVLLNILGNAIKYNHKGGMVEIDVSAVKSDNNNEKYIRITVTDSGPGIAEENIGKIFNPFERIGAEKTVTEGTGLGLSVSKKLTEAMNGFIGVESTVGKGSRFWVEYPFIQKGEIKKEQIIPEKVISYVKTEIEGTILYFEDNESNIELIEEIIIENRPSVKFFAQKDGMRAVEFTTEIMPDLILLDLNLPGKQGDKILEEILNSPILKNIPVIMVSADAMPNQIRNLLKIGARNYLTKPINVSQLLKTIDQYLMKEIK